MAVLVALAGTASGDVPIVDQTIPNSWGVEVTVHQCGYCKPDLLSEKVSPPGGFPADAVAGYWNVVDGGGGGYAAVAYGALGVSSTGFGDGSATISGATLIVNVPLSGSGTITVRLDIEGSSLLSPNNLLYPPEDSFSATANYGLTDASTLAMLESGGVRADECDPVENCNGRTPVSLPIHLSNTFTIDGPTLVYLYFYMGAGAWGPHTFVNAKGQIALDLAPGVTMSSFFLSTPGDPHLVPEPSTTWLSLAAGAVLAALARIRRPDTA